MVSKQAIVVTSFGSTYIETRKACINTIEEAVKESFPDWQVFRAFTSQHVITKIARKENKIVPNLGQRLEQLQKEGFEKILIQPTHLTPGEEFDNKILAVYQQFKQAEVFSELRLGRPVLYYEGQNGLPNDFDVVTEALTQQVPLLEKDELVLWMGHGSPNRHNPAYYRLQKSFDEYQKPWVIGVVEETDRPNFNDALATLKARGVKKVKLMPLLVVAGDHARNDMAGDDEDSWLNQLRRQGFDVTYKLIGLGENEAFRQIYIQHIKELMAKLPLPW